MSDDDIDGAFVEAMMRQAIKREIVTGWALYRDGVFYRAYDTEQARQEAAESYRPGSKHKWSYRRVIISTTGGEHG